MIRSLGESSMGNLQCGAHEVVGAELAWEKLTPRCEGHQCGRRESQGAASGCRGCTTRHAGTWSACTLASCGALRLHVHRAWQSPVQHVHLLPRTMRDEKSGPQVGKRMDRVFANPKATPACRDPLHVSKRYLPLLLAHKPAAQASQPEQIHVSLPILPQRQIQAQLPASQHSFLAGFTAG